MKLYTIGEIARGRMLLDSRGQPYKVDKSQIAKVVRMLNFKVIQTKWGPAKALSMSQIKKYNASITTLATR